MTDLPAYVRVSKQGRAYAPQLAAGTYLVEQHQDGKVLLALQPEQWPPYRFVCSGLRGWLTAGQPEGMAKVFPCLDGTPGSQMLPVAQIIAQWAPIRPVVPFDEEDEQRLRTFLARAKHRAVASTLAALGDVAKECMERDGHHFRLTAGRPGSSESALLLDLATTVPELPHGTVSLEARVAVRSTLSRWIFPFEAYVEVAENLAAIFGRVVDGRGGWDEVVDAQLPAQLRTRARALLGRHSDDRR